jgi:hypothetical protein|eukprot:COSAG06_NODE_142_length_22286_cov_5.328751_15_plen_771_part_00
MRAALLAAAAIAIPGLPTIAGGGEPAISPVLLEHRSADLLPSSAAAAAVAGVAPTAAKSSSVRSQALPHRQIKSGDGAGSVQRPLHRRPILRQTASELVLTNGLVSLGFAKDPTTGLARAGIDTLELLSLPGVNLLAAPLGHPQGYWDLDTRWCAEPNATDEGKTCRPHCSPTADFCGHTVVRNSSSLLEVRFNTAPSCGFSIALHYILKPGESGFHMFAVVKRDPAAPLNNTFGQSRLVLRLEPTIFTSSAVVDEGAAQQPETMRTAAFPAGELLRDPCDDKGCHKVMDATYRLANGSEPHSLHGSYYTKYEWASMSHKDSVHGTYGQAGGRHVGAFVISGSNEYVNGGPLHPELSIHMTDTTPCLLKMIQGSHDDFYDPTPEAHAPEDWSKLYGPFFVSLNTALSPEMLWADAATLAVKHQQSWPPKFMQHELWQPASARGGLSGKLSSAVVLNPLSPTFVILGEAGSQKPIAAQGWLGLNHWTEVAPDGSFALDNAVAGSYSLWVRAPGVLPIEQVIVDSIAITAGQVKTLGSITVPNALGSAGGSTVWQIGEVDASVAEFRFGRLAELHGWGLWLPIINTGLTNTSIDLGPCTSSRNRTGAQAAQLPFMQLLAGQVEGAQDTSVWNVTFPQPSGDNSKLKLLIGVSSAPTLRNTHTLKYDISINGKQKQHTIKDGTHLVNVTDVFSCPLVVGETTRPQTTHDDVRSAVRSGLCPGVTLEAELSAVDLKAENLLQLSLSAQTAKPACGRVVCPSAAIIYDFIRLERE